MNKLLTTIRGFAAVAILTIVSTTLANAECQPSQPLNINPGSTILCTGLDTDGFVNPQYDVVLDEDGNETITSIPVTDLRITVAAGAVVNDNILGHAFGLANGGHMVTNNGVVAAMFFGIGAGTERFPSSNNAVLNNGEITVNGGGDGIGFLGSNNTVTNAADATISVSGFGGEGVGIFGSGATITNFGTVTVSGDGSEGIAVEGSDALIDNFGFITVNGPNAEGISVEGSGARVTNTRSIGMVGDGTLGITVGGSNARITNSGGVATDGNLTAGISIGGAGGMIENSGSVTTLGRQSAAILGFGANQTIENSGRTAVGINSVAVGAIGDGGSVSNSSIVEANGSDSVGIMSLGAGKVVTNAAGGTIEVNGSDGIGIGLGFVTDLIQSLANIFNVPLPDSSGDVVNDGIVTVSGERGRGIVGRGDSITVTNNATIETDESGTGMQITGDNATLTNAASGEVRNGGVVLSGDNVTFANEGGLSGKGVTITAASGLIEALNTGIIELGDPDNFGKTLLAGFEFLGGGGSIRNEGDISGNTDTLGIAIQDISQALTIENAETGTIETDVAISGVGGPELVIDNAGTISARGGIGITAGTLASVTNSGTIEIAVPDNLPVEGLSDALGVQLYVDDSATFDNDGILSVTVTGQQDSGAVTLGAMSDSGSATLTNSGTIAVEGAATVSGVRLLANTVTATNGNNARISTTSAGNNEFWVIGMSASERAVARNDGELVALGQNGRGIGLRAEESETTFSILNSGRIEMQGTNSVGVLISGTSELTLTGEPFSKSRVVANEDTLTISGTGSRGMVLNPLVNSTRLENAGRFDVAGDNSKGIDILQGSENFVLNANGFRIAGDNAVGISVRGDRNTIMNGQDAAVFPDTDVLITPEGYYVGDANIDGLVLVISAFIDLADSSLGNVPLFGDLVVAGAGAIGIDIMGNDNKIANLPGNGRSGDLPNLGEGTPILAQGPGAIGVRINGSGNVFLNEGTVTGDSYAIHDGAGANTVINGAYVFGDIDLGGGDDSLVVREGAQMVGTARGGSGDDLLIAAMRTPDPGDAVGVGVLNGSQFIGFETFKKAGDNTLILDGTLDVITATILRGEMRLAFGAEVTGETIVNSGTVLSGTGLFGGVTVLEGGLGTVGTSPGRWHIANDLTLLGGILELEIGATPDTRDFISVGGAARFDGGTIRLQFIDDFMPDFGQLFELIIADILVGIETVSFDVIGLGEGLWLEPILSGSGGLGFITTQVAQPVSEPSSLHLLLLGVFALALQKRLAFNRCR